MAEVKFDKLRQECEANNMIANDAKGNPSRCVFSSQAGNPKVTLHPLPSVPSHRGGKKKRRKSRKSRKKSTKRKSRGKRKSRRKSKKVKRRTKKRRRRRK